MKKDKKTNNDLQITTHIQLKIFKLKIFKYNTKTTKNWGLSQVLRKGGQFLFHMWHLFDNVCIHIQILGKIHDQIFINILVGLLVKYFRQFKAQL
jgi:hypothetical protein